MEDCGKRDVVRSDYIDNYDDYHYDCQHDDCHSYDPEYDDYHDHHEYDDYGGPDDWGTYDMEEYQERDVMLSDVVPPQTDPNVLSVERVPADP